MATIIVAGRNRAVQYTGSNSAELLALCASWSFVSEIDDVLTVQDGFIQVEVSVGDWIVSPSDSSCNLYVSSGFDSSFMEVVTPDQLSVALEPVQALGVASVPSLLSNAQTTVDVTIRPSLPDTNYSAAASITGDVSLLGSLSVVSVTKTSGSSVAVQVWNTSSVTLDGATLMVAAVADV